MGADGLRKGFAVKQAGQVLLEVLVSVLLLGIALAPLMGLYPSLLSTQEAQRDAVVLGHVAAGKLEEVAQGLRGGSGVVGAGSEPCSALPRCRLQWRVYGVGSDPVAGWLRHVEVVACVDRDASGSCEPGETSVRYDTRATSRQ